MRELSRRSDLKGFAQAGGHLALFLATGALTYVLWLQEIWIAFLAALFLHGTVASFWNGVAGHELTHGSVFKTKWLNKLFLYMFSTISWFDPFDYSASHTYHHRYTLHPEGDREVLLPQSPTVGRTFLIQLLTVNLFTHPGRTLSKGGLIATILCTARSALGPAGSNLFFHNEWLDSVHRDQPRQHMRSAWFSRWQLFFHSAVLVVSIATGQWVWVLLLSVASYIGNWGRYVCVMAQHCGLTDNTPDFRKCVRSMTMIWPLEFLYWNMNWHLEHHMYAGVPCYNLKKLHQGNRPRHAQAAHPGQRLAGDAPCMGPPAGRPGLPVRHSPAGRGRAGRPRQIKCARGFNRRFGAQRAGLIVSTGCRARAADGVDASAPPFRRLGLDDRVPSRSGR